MYREILEAKIGEDTQERNARKLEALRLQPGTDNDVCADCGTGERTSWANLSFGVFICMTCAGLHRKLALKQGGSSAVSRRVKSMTVDDWTREEIDTLSSQGGNRIVNMALNPGKEQPPPAGDIGQLEMFMRAKYETRALQKQHARRTQKRQQREQQQYEQEQQRSSRSRDQSGQSVGGASVGSQPTWKQTPQESQHGAAQEQPLVAMSQPQSQSQTQSQPQPQLLPATNTAAPLQFYQQPVQYQMPQMPQMSQMVMSCPQQQQQQQQQMSFQAQYFPQQYQQQYVYQQPAMQMMQPQQQQIQMPQYQYMSFQQQPQQMFYQ